MTVRSLGGWLIFGGRPMTIGSLGGRPSSFGGWRSTLVVGQCSLAVGRWILDGRLLLAERVVEEAVPIVAEDGCFGLDPNFDGQFIEAEGEKLVVLGGTWLGFAQSSG